MLTDEDIAHALKVLDAKVAQAEVRVVDAEKSLRQATAQLRDAQAERRGADALVTLLLRTPAPAHREAGSGAEPAAKVPRGVNTGLAGILEKFARTSNLAVLTVDDAMAAPDVRAVTTDRDQVRNSLHYLARRRHVIESVGRGMWKLKNAEAPAATGASDAEESMHDSSRVEGGPDDGSEPPAARGHGTPFGRTDHNVAGDRTSIGGFNH